MSGLKVPAAPKAQALGRPKNEYHAAAEAVQSVVAVPGMAIDKLNTGFATATQDIANAFPNFPAATLGSLAIGIPHAHFTHPPSGPPPLPPIPLPPIGPLLFGCSVQVVINGLPAARCGDLGLNPTCCAFTPIFEMFTGSSNVFIGGARAARATDVSWHCRSFGNNAAARGAATAAKASASASKLAKLGTIASMGMMGAGMAAQGLNVVGDSVAAAETDDAAMAAALGLNAQMMAMQMGVDAAAMAMAMVMGKDPSLPPTGTLGAVIGPGSPNVVIGGFPMPSWMDIARGLGKLAKALRRRRGNKGNRDGCEGGCTRGCPG